MGLSAVARFGICHIFPCFAAGIHMYRTKPADNSSELFLFASLGEGISKPFACDL